MCVCVCVYMVEYAEALTNPIKHVSLLDQRDRQLAVLIEDNSEVSLNVHKFCNMMQHKQEIISK